MRPPPGSGPSIFLLSCRVGLVFQQRVLHGPQDMHCILISKPDRRSASNLTGLFLALLMPLVFFNDKYWALCKARHLHQQVINVIPTPHRPPYCSQVPVCVKCLFSRSLDPFSDPRRPRTTKNESRDRYVKQGEAALLRILKK